MTIKAFIDKLKSVEGATPQQRLEMLRELAETSKLGVVTITRIAKVLHDGDNKRTA